MSMHLQMIQKKPVVFTQYDPERVISQTELILALNSRRIDALAWLWLSYGRAVLADVEPCMEANDGVAATIAYASCYKSLSKMEVNQMSGACFELKVGNASLYLSETADGDIFLYFFSPAKYYNRREECRIDLTDYSSDAAAYFIATIFDSYESIERYFDTNRHE